MDDIITLSYGSGGKKTSQLIEEMLLPAFNNEELSKLRDGAIIKGFEKLAFSTDSFVVDPIFFPGGDIGKLSVCGTVNDICMCGAIPKYISLALIIEEGFKTSQLRTIVESIGKTAAACNVSIVTGDTKVIEKGKGDGIFINTAGIGQVAYDFLSMQRVEAGDAVIVSGTMGDHGAAIMAARNNLITGSGLTSDCMPLINLSGAMFEFGDNIKVLRDPTRGGLATTLNEFIENTEFCIELIEDDIPLNQKVVNFCELLGLDPLYSANEGKIVAIVKAEAAENIVRELNKYQGGEAAAIIGKVSKLYPGRVVLKTNLGGTRILSKLSGAQLPRIC